MSRCDVVLTCALNKEFLSVAAQQGPREEGGKVYKDLSQQRSCLLQSMFQTLRDTGGENKTQTQKNPWKISHKTNLQNVKFKYPLIIC